MSQQPLLRIQQPGGLACPPCLMADVGNSTETATADSAFVMGNGLIEIAALTSLIGSATAQTLALGNKGPAGLVWATMTIFGGMSVVRACIAAVTPGWVRDSLGVRSAETDAAVGLSLDLKQKGTRFRTRGGVAKAVECEVKDLNDPVDIVRRDVYISDQRTSYVVAAVPPAGPGDSLKIYNYARDPFYKETTVYQAWIDRIWLLLSSVKLVEVGVLWKYGAVTLALVTVLPWLFFLLAGIVLQIHGRSLKRLDYKHASVIDTIVASNLPIPSSPGGTRKIVLGIPTDPRRYVIWTIVWALSSVVCAASVVATYICLGQAPGSQIFVVWIIFQVVWMALRSTFFHMVEDRERPYPVGLKGKSWAEAGSQEKTRVRNLVLGLAKYQYHVHPRGPWSYNEDAENVTSLQTVQPHYPFSHEAEVQISVHGVIGDTLLSSISWVYGSEKGGFDFYDTCIIILKIKGSEIAIPAARVLSATRPPVPSDPEHGSQSERPQRGSSNMAEGIEWWFWIPYGNGQWLHFGSQDLKFKGQRTAVVLTDEEVTRKLERGELFISLKHVDEVKEIVQTSTEACKHLLEIFA